MSRFGYRLQVVLTVADSLRTAVRSTTALDEVTDEDGQDEMEYTLIDGEQQESTQEEQLKP